MVYTMTEHAQKRRRRPLSLDADKVRRKRIEAGLTQELTAEKVGVTKGYVCQIETGRRGGSPAVIVRLAAALGCQVADLMPDIPVKAAV